MRTIAVIHLDCFLGNLKAVRARIGRDRRICIPVKADAYGHGALKIAKTGLKAGAYCLGVAAVSEGVELRKGGIRAPILLFSQPHPDEIPELVQADLTPFVSDAWFASALNECSLAEGIKLPVHLKIDTGMGRLGCAPQEAPALARHVAECAALELTGTATHLAVSDSSDERDIAYTQAQIARFKEAVAAIRDAGFNTGIVHAANSGAVIQYPEAWFDMVRPGILLYGYKAVEENRERLLLPPLEVRPVMELRSVVSLIKKVKKGETVSYGRTWIAPRDTFIAVLSTGYGDGLPRPASGKWQAVIDDKTYPIAGRICMDQCVVDLGDEPDAGRWDEAILFGGDAPDAAALAAVVGTIPYEITCNINKRVPRVYEN